MRSTQRRSRSRIACIRHRHKGWVRIGIRHAAWPQYSKRSRCRSVLSLISVRGYGPSRAKAGSSWARTRVLTESIWISPIRSTSRPSSRRPTRPAGRGSANPWAARAIRRAAEAERLGTRAGTSGRYPPRSPDPDNISRARLAAVGFVIRAHAGRGADRLAGVGAPGVPASHHELAGRHVVEAEPPVQAVRIARPEHPPSDALEIRVRQHDGDEPLAETAAAVFRLDVDVAEPGERRRIRHDASHADLPAVVDQGERE